MQLLKYHVLVPDPAKHVSMWIITLKSGTLALMLDQSPSSLTEKILLGIPWLAYIVLNMWIDVVLFLLFIENGEVWPKPNLSTVNTNF